VSVHCELIIKNEELFTHEFSFFFSDSLTTSTSHIPLHVLKCCEISSCADTHLSSDCRWTERADYIYY